MSQRNMHLSLNRSRYSLSRRLQRHLPAAVADSPPCTLAKRNPKYHTTLLSRQYLDPPQGERLSSPYACQIPTAPRSPPSAQMTAPFNPPSQPNPAPQTPSPTLHPPPPPSHPSRPPPSLSLSLYIPHFSLPSTYTKESVGHPPYSPHPKPLNLCPTSHPSIPNFQSQTMSAKWRKMGGNDANVRMHVETCGLKTTVWRVEVGG